MSGWSVSLGMEAVMAEYTFYQVQSLVFPVKGSKFVGAGKDCSLLGNLENCCQSVQS